MQTVKKGVWLDPIGLSHTADHIWCSFVALLVFNLFVPLSVIAMMLVVFVEGITHYIIDFVKVKYGIKDNTKPLFWNQFGLDQLAHQSCYLLMVWYLLIL
jgi:hypothetical protein